MAIERLFSFETLDKLIDKINRNFSFKSGQLPVGSVYTSVVSTNPSTLLGYGTWVAFGAGRTLVGIDPADTDFDTAEETRGEKTHTLTGAESGTSVHGHPGTYRYNDGATPGAAHVTHYSATSVIIDMPSSITIGNSSAANAANAHNNIQPSIVVFMWKRVS